MSLDDDAAAEQYRKAQAARMVLNKLSEEEMRTKPQEYLDELRRLADTLRSDDENY